MKSLFQCSWLIGPRKISIWAVILEEILETILVINDWSNGREVALSITGPF